MRSFFAFLGGAAVGATVALLLAPDKGSVTRRKIGTAFAEGKDRMLDAVEEGRDRVSDVIRSRKEKLTKEIEALEEEV